MIKTLVSYNFAIALVTFAVCAFWFGSLIRIKIPEYILSADALAAGRFSAIPLILVTGIVMSLMLFTARASFDAKQALVEDMAGGFLQADRALSYFGTPQSIKARDELREYLRWSMENPDAIFKGQDRVKVEPFMRDIQSLPIPAKDTGIAQLTKKFLADTLGRVSLDRFKLATATNTVIYPFSMTLLIGWVIVLFLFIGVTSPPLNAPAFWFAFMVAVCTGSISFLICEYQTGTAGLIRISDEPFRILMQSLGD